MINLMLFLAVALWGLSFIATKIVLDYLDPAEVIALRLLIGTPALLIIAKAKGKSFKFDKKDFNILIASSIVLGAHFVIQAIGLIYTSATNSAWLIATVPVFTCVAAFVFLKERISKKGWLGIAVATFGVIFLVSKGNLDSVEWLKSKGDWIVLISCITWTTYTVITRNMVRKYDPLAFSAGVLVLPATILLIYLFVFSSFDKLVSLPIDIILYIILLGLFMLGLAHWFWIEGVSAKGASKASVFLYLEPLVTTAAAVPLLNEPITISLAIGAVLIISGVYFVQR